ncbi:MAG TPA: poly-gamma-glutamate synthase PgsB [Polyangiaceae bacterium]|nr:poly-gamma-glutamate synthase PgsB [Polyangiaceae bacterium]
MTGVEVLVAVTAILVILGVVELSLHARRLATIRIRIHVNGTRGKSSVTRLIAAALREAGIRTCAKTTGSTARMILPDGHELPIYRPGGPNIIEQKRIVAVAAAYNAEALVIECMALSPLLQSLCELKLVRATHAVITNVRPDHLEVMGPKEPDVGRALIGITPVRGKLYTSEHTHLDLLRMAAADRKSELIVVDALDDHEVLEKFRYTEHADNVALALAVCADLGIERDVALRGMWKARPDPGAMTERRLDFFGRRIVFVNGFAANDPVSSEQVWSLTLERHNGVQRTIAVFNCRNDRPDRSRALGEACAAWRPADHVVLMGSSTHLFADAATRAGIDATKLVFVEGLPVEEVFERIVSLTGESALVMGMGNIGGDGLKLAAYFANRAAPERD